MIADIAIRTFTKDMYLDMSIYLFIVAIVFLQTVNSFPINYAGATNAWKQVDCIPVYPLADAPPLMCFPRG